MRFIPKQKLCEGMAANPLDHNINTDNDITTLAQEGILTAVAAETDAINQYTQILDMVSKSEMWLKELAYDQIQDIINEEKKHLAQLSNIVAHLPAVSEQWNKGWKEAETGEDVGDSEEETQEEAKESIEESVISEDVNADRTYDLYGVLDSLKEWLINNGFEFDEEDEEAISDCFYYHRKGTELSAEEVDMGISDFIGKFSTENNNMMNYKSDIEDYVMKNTANPQQERVDDFESSISYDISTLEDLLNKESGNKIYTQACADGINNVIDSLKTLEYTGDKEVDWRF